MSGYYILNPDHSVTPCKDVRKWAMAFEKMNRRVAHDVIGRTSISTVFLGLNHAFEQSESPLLFETMTFPDNETCERCSTWDEAVAQHRRVCAKVREKEA